MLSIAYYQPKFKEYMNADHSKGELDLVAYFQERGLDITKDETLRSFVEDSSLWSERMENLLDYVDKDTLGNTLTCCLRNNLTKLYSNEIDGRGFYNRMLYGMLRDWYKEEANCH